MSSPNPSEGDPVKTLAAGLGRIPSGLFVITYTGLEGETAMLGSWVQQCSFEPPQVSVAVRSDREAARLLTAGTSFTINILGEGQNALVGHFARGPAPGKSPFEGQVVERPVEGGIVLANALAWLHCRVVTKSNAGDHDLLIARVTAGKLQGEGRPMVHVRKNGLTY